jgi:uncharacterized protein YjiS (DUF1127 family)
MASVDISPMKSAVVRLMLQCINSAGTPRHSDAALSRSVWTHDMSAHLADSNFSHRLPSLSYIDAKWEEPNLRQTDVAAPRKGFLTRLMANIQAWFRTQEAMTELGGMSDRELHDIGLTRSDVMRVFDPELNQDLRQRGLRG